jgi:ATP-dependent RNA helicase RhlE
VNFDVPNSPEDYVHRVGRTARADATGDAFLFVAPEEESDLRGIEKAIGKRLPRITLPGFDYSKRPAEKLEVPLAQRLAQMRAHRGHGARPAARVSRRPQGPAWPRSRGRGQSRSDHRRG